MMSIANFPTDLKFMMDLDVPFGECFDGTFSGFPPEILEQFLTYLNPKDLYSLASTSKGCCEIVNNCTTVINTWEPEPFPLGLALTRFSNLVTLSIHDPSTLSDWEIVHLSTLRRLKNLRVDNISSMEDPAALLRSLWTLTTLETLYLDFGDSEPEEDYASLVSLVMLNNLKSLTLLNLPKEWNQFQTAILSNMGFLEEIHLTFKEGPGNLDILASLSRLTKLTLKMVDNRDIGAYYTIPAIPSLRHLSLPDGNVDPESVAAMSSLQHLEITPWGWKKESLEMFPSLKMLAHLSLRVNWLPSTDPIARLFGNLVSLTLVEFDTSRCFTLTKLKNLQMLCLDSPSRNGKPLKSKHLSPVSEMLKSMPWLQAFSLVNAPHITPEVGNTLAHHCPKLRHLEISGCNVCVQQLFCITSELQSRLVSLFVHCDGFDFDWIQSCASLEVLYLTNASMVPLYFKLEDIPWEHHRNLIRVETSVQTFPRPYNVPEGPRARSLSF